MAWNLLPSLGELAIWPRDDSQVLNREQDMICKLQSHRILKGTVEAGSAYAGQEGRGQGGSKAGLGFHL